MRTMKSRDIVKTLFNRAGVSQSDYAKRLGISRAALWDRLSTNKATDMTASVLAKMVSVLGYKVTVMPKDYETPSAGFDVE